VADVPPIPTDIQPYPVVADIDFAEGPIFDRQGNLYFVNYLRNGTIGRKTPDGTVSVWCETGGQANGLKVDKDGSVVVADYGGKRILRVQPNGTDIEVVTDSYEGEPYLGPNDVCFDLAGNLYFSDPTGSSNENPIGRVYRVARDGSVTLLADGMAFPNGLAVSPDQSKLYVAESSPNRLMVFDLTADGRAENKRVVREWPDPTLDGIMFDEHGRLWVARWTGGTVDVVSETGELLGSVNAGGDKVTNLCWWETSLYVTVSGQHSVHRLDVGCRGAEIVPRD
jgi:sugar lactone lactonase YvrE